jgi:hypothetical protein
MFMLPDHDSEDFNRLPSRREMACQAIYWNWISQILGSSVGGHIERENERIAALRKNAEHYDRQRKPSLVSEIIAEAVDHVVSVLPAPIARALTARERVMEWLRETLANGPIAATVLEKMADEAGVKRRTLERARRKLGLKPRRINGRSFWLLPDGNSANK